MTVTCEWIKNKFLVDIAISWHISNHHQIKFGSEHDFYFKKMKLKLSKNVFIELWVFLYKFQHKNHFRQLPIKFVFIFCTEHASTVYLARNPFLTMFEILFRYIYCILYWIVTQIINFIPHVECRCSLDILFSIICIRVFLYACSHEDWIQII